MTDEVLSAKEDETKLRPRQTEEIQSPLIQAESLGRSFASHRALDDVSLSIGPGTICSVLGPNGAGKTTLLRLLYGLITPTAGTCSIGGDSALPRTERSMQLAGCLIDGIEPPGHITIGEFTLLNQCAASKFDLPRAKAMLETKQLSPRKRWRTLSKGQKRWAALVMLLCRDCDVLLLDEPADGLDPHSRAELYNLLRREANDRGVAVLVTTHIIDDIEKITDQVCILKQGKVLFEEPLEDLRDQVFAIVLDDPDDIPSEVQVLHQTGGESDSPETHSPATVWVRDIIGHLDGLVLPSEIRRDRASLAELYRVIIDQSNSPQTRESK